MEKQLDFVLKLSLKEMALRKLVVCLCNENDILNVMENDIFSNLTNCRIKFEIRIKSKISKLVLPESLKEEMMCLVTPIGFDIRRWRNCHVKFIGYFDLHILKQLQWSCTGVIDYQKTAEKLVCLEMLDIVDRYRLACFYCLYDYILLLWKELGEYSRMQFYQFDPKGISEIELENAWPFILEGEQLMLDEITRRNFSKSFIESVMISAARCGNKAPIKYFLPQLTDEEKHSFLVTAICNMIDNIPPWLLFAPDSRGRLGDALCYFLSMMRPEEQMQVLREKPYQILCCLLDWPWFDLFVDLTNILWNFLSEDRSFKVLHIVRDYKCYCPVLFQKLFLSGPSEFRRGFVHHESRRFEFFSDFFLHRDTQSIKVVLRNLNASDRVDLVSGLNFFERFNCYLWKYTHLIELCFREAIQSKEDKDRLKNRFTEAFESCYASKSLLSKKHKWEQLIELLDVADATSANKRRLEDTAVIEDKKTSLKSKRMF